MKQPNRRRPRNERREHVLWSKEEIKTLQKLLGQETPIQTIAATLKKTAKAIRRKCDWLGVSSATIYRTSARKKIETSEEVSPSSVPEKGSKRK